MASTIDLFKEQISLFRILDWLTIQRQPFKQVAKRLQPDDTYTLTVQQTAQKFEDQFGTTKFNRAIYDV